jgi:hypothetical protein
VQCRTELVGLDTNTSDFCDFDVCGTLREGCFVFHCVLISFDVFFQFSICTHRKLKKLGWTKQNLNCFMVL